MCSVKKPVVDDAMFRCLLVLLAIDLSIILSSAGVSVVNATGGDLARNWLIDLEAPDSFPSLLLVGKWLAAVMLIGLAARREEGRGLACCAVLFALILVDDFFELHERIGGALVPLLDIQPRFGLRAQDFGELAVMAVLGVAAVILLWNAFAATRGALRRWVGVMMGLVVLLAGFGAVVDLVHSLAVHAMDADHAARSLWSRGLSAGLSLMEDGGELVVGSLIVGHAARAGALAGAVRQGARTPVGTNVVPAE